MKWNAEKMKDADVIFHLHIPKTAGTSLREAFREAIPEDEFLEWHPENPYLVEESIENLREILRQRPRTRVVTGHFLYGMHRALENGSYTYITVMRHPVARALSHYMHEIQNNLPLISRENSRAILESDIASYSSSERLKFFYHNVHSRFISGMVDRGFDGLSDKALAARCLDHVEKDFAAVGTQENLNWITQFISGSLGTDAFRYREENTRNRLSPEEILPREYYEAMFRENAADCNLIAALGLDIPMSDDFGAVTGSREKFGEAKMRSMRLSIENLLQQNTILRTALDSRGAAGD